MKTMRHKFFLTTAGLCLALAILLICLAPEVLSKRPFKDIDGENIVSAKVELMPPDVELEVSDTEKLAELLRQVVIYRRDDSYKDYDGQAAVFTLSMKDGTAVEITDYTPFVIIDGVGYKAKYEPCEALNSYANALLSRSGK